MIHACFVLPDIPVWFRKPNLSWWLLERDTVHVTMATERKRQIVVRRPNQPGTLMNEEEMKQVADEARLDTVLQTIKDIMFRFDEQNAGTYTLYDLMGYLAEDLVEEGCCATCIKEAIDAAFEQAGIDTTQHRQDGDAVYH